MIEVILWVFLSYLPPLFFGLVIVPKMNALGKSKFCLNEQGIPYWRKATPEENKEVYQLALLASMIRINGTTDTAQLQFVADRHLSQYGDIKRERLRTIFDALLRKKYINSIDLAELLANMMVYSEKVKLAELIMELLTCDNRYDPIENQYMLQIATLLGVKQEDYNTMFFKHIASRFPQYYSQSTKQESTQQTKARQQQQRSQTPPPRRNTQPRHSAYTTLGIAPTATDEEVKRAYRRLAMQYHPDRIAATDAETLKKAETRFRQITQAYQQIRKARGMK